jgi:hypothetical protein
MISETSQTTHIATNPPQGSHTILWVSAGSLGLASAILRATVLCFRAGATNANSDRHDLDHLPVLHGRHRVQTHDRPLGRAVCLPRLRPHGAPRRARLQVHLPNLLEAARKTPLTDHRNHLLTQ